MSPPKRKTGKGKSVDKPPAAAAPVFPAALQPVAALLDTIAAPPGLSSCDRGDDKDSGDIALDRAKDVAVFDFYLCRMNGDLQITLTAMSGQPFQQIDRTKTSASHDALPLPVADMPAGTYSLVWQFTGIMPPDWTSCAEFTRNDVVIFRIKRNDSSGPGKDRGALIVTVT